ncbi:hypothetical protein [Halpernia sp. GG3]
MTEIIVGSNNVDEIMNSVRSANLNGNDISSFLLTGLFSGYLAVLFGILISLIINYLQKLTRLNLFLIAIINLSLLYYHKDFNKPGYYLGLNFLNVDMKSNILTTGLFFFIISTLIFYLSWKLSSNKENLEVI